MYLVDCPAMIAAPRRPRLVPVTHMKSVRQKLNHVSSVQLRRSVRAFSIRTLTYM